VAKESREPTDIDRRDALQHQIAVFLTFPSEDALVLKRRYHYTTAVSRDSEPATDRQVAPDHAARRSHALGGDGRGTVALVDASDKASGKQKQRKDVEVSRGRFAYLACACGVVGGCD